MILLAEGLLIFKPFIRYTHIVCVCVCVCERSFGTSKVKFFETLKEAKYHDALCCPLKAALKKYQMEHKSKGESLEKCQAELKKLRRKSQGSKNPAKYGEKEMQVSSPWKPTTKRRARRL